MGKHLIAVRYGNNGNASRFQDAFSTFFPGLFVISLYLCLMCVCSVCSTHSLKIE